jgi:hypothetical protein
MMGFSRGGKRREFEEGAKGDRTTGYRMRESSKRPRRKRPISVYNYCGNIQLIILVYVYCFVKRWINQRMHAAPVLNSDQTVIIRLRIDAIRGLADVSATCLIRRD